MPHGEVVVAGAVLPAHQEQRAPGVVGGAEALVLLGRQLAVEDRGRGHEAQRHAAPWICRAVGLGAMHQEDVVERHLPGFEHQVDGPVLVEGGGREL